MLRRGAEVCGRRATLDAEISKGRPSTPANTPWADTITKPDLVLRRITRSWHEPRKTAEGSRLRLHLHREQTSPHIVLDSLRWWSQHSLGKVKRVGLVKLVTVRSPCVRGVGELKSASESPSIPRHHQPTTTALRNRRDQDDAPAGRTSR